jgi:hypothetical protein
MKKLFVGVLTAAFLVSAAGGAFAEQRYIPRGGAGHFNGARGFAGHGFGARPGGARYAYSHGVRYRHWDGYHRVYVYDGDDGYDPGYSAAPDAAAAIFGLAVGAALQAAQH